MKQLSESELAELDRLWGELWALYPASDVPETDDEVVAACVDSFIAGIVSSEGRFDRSRQVEVWADIVSPPVGTVALANLIRRLAALLRLP